MNIANPANPFEVGYYDTPGYAFGVYVLGSYAYVADKRAGLQIYEGPLIGIEEDKRPLSTDPILLRIYSNPASSYFAVRLSSAADCIRIYDITGKLVKVNESKSSGVDELKVSLDGIKNGVYFIKVGKETEKLIVKR